jgi:ABC-type glycerol-3-phosphate transport system substrate-binding protein
MTKKRFVLFVAFVFIVLLVTACGGGEDADVQAIPEKFLFSTWGDPTFFEAGFNGMKTEYSEYENVQFEFLPGGDDTDELLSKIIVDFAAEAWDTMPDAAEMNTNMIPQLAEAGVAVDLTSYIEPFKDDISPAILDGITYEGKVYAVPFMPNSGMIWYNNDVFTEAGINADDIETWDDYMEAGRQIRDFEFADGVDRYITSADIGWGPGMALQLMLQQGCSGFFDPETGDLTIENDPVFRKAFTLWTDAFAEGILLEVAEWDTPWYNGLNEGIIATYPSANWMDQVIQQELENQEGVWRAMMLPALESGGSRIAFEGGSANVIVLNKTGLNKDMVWAFLEYSFLNKDVTGELVSSFNLVPAYLPAMDHPYYTDPNEFYGGQEVGKLDKQIQQSDACAFPYTENFAESMDLVLVEMLEVWAGNKTVDEAIADAASAIREATQ